MTDFKITYDQPEVADSAIRTLEFIVQAFDQPALFSPTEERLVGVIPLGDGWIYVYDDGDCHHSYSSPEKYQEALNA